MASAQVAVTIGGSCVSSITYGGQEWRAPIAPSVASIYFGSTSVTPGTASTTTGTSPTKFCEKLYRDGQQYQFTIRAEFSTPDANTLQLDVYLTNQDSTDAITAFDFRVIGHLAPSAPTNYPGTGYSLKSDAGDPVGYIAGAFGGLAWWWAPPQEAVTLATVWSSGSQTQFDHQFLAPSSSAPENRTFSLSAGQTWHGTVQFRWSSSTTTKSALGADGYAAYRSTYPQITNWPDRRPIAQWVVANPSERSATNPRGFWSDDTLNASNSSAFVTAGRAALTDIVNDLNGRPIRSQGVIVWDLEGQEFNHSVTYLGHPDLLSQVAPDMDGFADEMFATLRGAGYLVGGTIRPQRMLALSSVPETCATHASDADYREKLILTSATFPNRFYRCKTDGTYEAADISTGTVNGEVQYQIAAKSDILAILRTKIDYARARWGWRLFYVDTNVDTSGAAIDGEVWRILQSEYPDCLFILEWQTSTSYGASAAYDEDSQGMSTEAMSSGRDVYPSAVTFVNVSDWDGTTNRAVYESAVARGDSGIHRGWFPYTDTQAMESVFATANTQASALTITADGSTRTWTGSPRTAFQYPLVMRIAFSASSTFTGNETTYCEKRDTAQCWAAGVRQATASLDLTGFTHFRREYRDFHGRLVSAGVAETK